MLRRTLLTAARSDGVRRAVETTPYTRGVVRRFVAGTGLDEALRVTRDLVDQGLLVSLDHLGEDVRDEGQATATVQAYLSLLERLAAGGLGGAAEVSVKLSALGQELDEGTALRNARHICEAARSAGTTVTLDMEGHETVASTLRILDELRADHPDTGAVVQASLHRAEEYCHRLAVRDSRVRLCKGAYDAPEDVAFQNPADVDRSYVRCMKTLMTGQGYPMFATHDPRLIEIAGTLAVLTGRDPRTFEYQMLFGVRPNEQRRLSGVGARVRVYLPYGAEWYGYLMRRLAERPANLVFFLRSLATRS